MYYSMSLKSRDLFLYPGFICSNYSIYLYTSFNAMCASRSSKVNGHLKIHLTHKSTHVHIYVCAYTCGYK